MNRPRRLINQRLARSLFLQAASDWGRPMARPPAGFYAGLEKALTLKIQAEAAHPGNRKPHRTHFPSQGHDRLIHDPARRVEPGDRGSLGQCRKLPFPLP